MSCSALRNGSMDLLETKVHSHISKHGDGSCVQDTPDISQIIHTLLRRRKAEFITCRCPRETPLTAFLYSLDIYTVLPYFFME